MFKVNDCVVYGSTGVCRITEQIRGKDIEGRDTFFYVLHPVFRDNMTIKAPVANAGALMRSVITKEEVLILIDAMPEKEPLRFADKRQRYTAFKFALKTGAHDEWIQIIKTLYLEKCKSGNPEKKLTKSDEEIMTTAEQRLYEEFAIALDMVPEEVLPFILERLS